MEDSILKCSICAKSFSGVVPYSQHMQSAKHLKKQKQVESELLNEIPTTEEGKLCCSICDMKFSGVIPYTQHMNGSIHHKNVRRQKLMNDLYTDCHLNKIPQKAPPQKPPSQTWNKNIEDLSFHTPHSSQSNPFDLMSLHDQLPFIPSSGQASGTTTPSYTLWEEVNESASKMNIPPPVTLNEGRLNGCGICGIPFFENSEMHIIHLESDDHFIKKLMSIKREKSCGDSFSDAGYGSIR